MNTLLFVLPLLALLLPVALAHRPDEQPDLFEGDIELPPSDGFRSALNDRSRLWENGVIPYEISAKSYFTDEQRANITAAMEEFHKHSCVRWVPRKDEESFILFSGGRGCSSNVGRLRQVTKRKFTQRIILDWGCFNKGIIMHEMMHTIGFFHEQSRWDRDSYIRIMSQNIKQGVMPQFRVHRIEQQDKELGPYDYGSLMHYRKNTFSAEGDDTIVPLKEGAEIGQREGFSEVDIYKINKLYRCPGHNSATLPADAWKKPAPVDESPQYPSDRKTEFSCSFNQKRACDFHDELSSNLDWVIGKGASTRDNRTGPSADAFNEECCYMHINTVGHIGGDKASLVGPFLKPGIQSCLTFYYHMKGATIGTLRVYIRDYRGKEGAVVFEKTGQQSTEWLRVRVPVMHHLSFQLVFEATVGGSEFFCYDGNIAIDSVRYGPLSEPGVDC